MSRNFTRPILGLLLALGALLGPRPAVAQEGRIGLDAVPARPMMFASIRVAELVRKMDLKKSGVGFALLTRFEERIGIPLAEVERLTVVVTGPEGGYFMLIQTASDLDTQAVLKKCCDNPRKLRRRGLTAYRLDCNDAFIHFPSDRECLITGSLEVLGDCLSDEQRKAPKDAPVKELLAAAARHDVVAWSRAVSNKELPNRSCAPCVSGYTTSYYQPVAARKEMAFLAFGGLPVPAGTEAVSLTIDVGQELALDVNLHFRDAAAARGGVERARLGVDLFRCLLLTMATGAELTRLGADEKWIEEGSEEEEAEVGEKEVEEVCALLRQTEKVLQKVEVKASETKIPVSLRLPVDGKKLCSVILSLGQLGLPDCGRWNAPVFERYHSGGTLPTARYLEHPPAHLPAPSDPLVGYSCRPGGPCPEPAPLATYPTAPPANPQTSPPLLPPTEGPPPPPPEGSTPPARPKDTVVVAVANVRKEPALVFAVQGSGDLRFLQKVPAGEAHDVQGTEGDNWVVVFANKPEESEKLSLSPQTKTWLLRERSPAPSPVIPAGAGWSNHRP